MKRMKRVLALGMRTDVYGATACGKDLMQQDTQIGIRCKLSCTV